MSRRKIIKIVCNTIYSTGALITLVLCCVAIFGSSNPVNPDAMLPFTWREQASIWLSIGSLPMLAACVAANHVNDFKKPYRWLVYLPGLTAGVCAVIVISQLVLAGLLTAPSS